MTAIAEDDVSTTENEGHVPTTLTEGEIHEGDVLLSESDADSYGRLIDVVSENEDAFPEWLILLKHYVNGTGLFQSHDVSKSHGTFRTLANNNTHILVEHRDEGLTPMFMNLVDQTLQQGGCKSGSLR